MMDRLTAVSARPAWETKADWETLTREIKDRCSNTWIYGTSNSLLKSLLGPLEYLARHRAQKACTKAAILLRLFRMKHVTYPETLDTLASELVGKPLVDPFSGKGLMYRRDGNGFIIYSVGPNGADDGGAKTSSGPADDVAVKVER